MEQKQVPGLSRGALQASGVSVELGEFPERVLQIGEGNFMRGFIDWMLYRMNQRGCFHGRSVAIQPTPRGKSYPSSTARMVCLHWSSAGWKRERRSSVSSGLT